MSLVEEFKEEWSGLHINDVAKSTRELSRDSLIKREKVKDLEYEIYSHVKRAQNLVRAGVIKRYVKETYGADCDFYICDMIGYIHVDIKFAPGMDILITAAPFETFEKRLRAELKTHADEAKHGIESLQKVVALCEAKSLVKAQDGQISLVEATALSQATETPTGALSHRPKGDLVAREQMPFFAVVALLIVAVSIGCALVL